MIIPSKIKGRHKIRDAAICIEWEKWHDSDAPKTEATEAFKKRLCAKFGLKQRRIEQILISNYAYIPINREAEKKKRINWLKRQISKKGDKTTKDCFDLQEQLRKEIEGEKSAIDQSHHITVIVEKYSDQDIQATREAVAGIQRSF